MESLEENQNTVLLLTKFYITFKKKLILTPDFILQIKNDFINVQFYNHYRYLLTTLQTLSRKYASKYTFTFRSRTKHTYC